MDKIAKQKALHIFIFILGIFLIIGGATEGKTSAMIIGIIVTAVNAQSYRKLKGKGRE